MALMKKDFCIVTVSGLGKLEYTPAYLAFFSLDLNSHIMSWNISRCKVNMWS